MAPDQIMEGDEEGGEGENISSFAPNQQPCDIIVQQLIANDEIDVGNEVELSLEEDHEEHVEEEEEVSLLAPVEEGKEEEEECPLVTSSIDVDVASNEANGPRRIGRQKKCSDQEISTTSQDEILL